MSKPFDAAVLEASPFYPLALETMWQMRMLPETEPGGRTGPVADHAAQAYINLCGVLVHQTGFTSHDVLTHVMEKDFARWMASPQGIEHNRMFKEKQSRG